MRNALFSLLLGCLFVTGGCNGPFGSPVAPAPLSVTSVSPDTGPIDSPRDVAVSGTGFQTGVRVEIGGVAATVIASSPNRINAKAPLHDVGTVDVVVTNPDGATVMLHNAYAFVPVTVTSIDPAQGVALDSIVITGTGFVAGATLTFDGAVARLTTVTAVRMTATLPLHDRGVVDVVFKNPGGPPVTLPGGYTYEAIVMTASPASVAPGGALTLSWVAPRLREAGEWMQLCRLGEGINCVGWSAHTGGENVGSYPLTAPLAPGQYEFRYMVGDTAIARSNPVAVTAGF